MLHVPWTAHNDDTRLVYTLATMANKKPKINQTVVAREAGMTQPQVSNYLSGKVWPSAQSLIRLAAALGVEPDVLAMMLARKRVSRLAKG